MTVVAPPTSETDAIREANKTVNQDELMLFRVQQLRIPATQFGRFETGAYRDDSESNLNEEFEGTVQVGADEYDYAGMSGLPRAWKPNLAQSSAGDLFTKAKAYPYGAVHLVGCFTDHRIFHFEAVAAPGSPVPTPSPTPFTGRQSSARMPTTITIEYQPAKRWCGSSPMKPN